MVIHALHVGLSLKLVGVTIFLTAPKIKGGLGGKALEQIQYPLHSPHRFTGTSLLPNSRQPGWVCDTPNASTPEPTCGGPTPPAAMGQPSPLDQGTSLWRHLHGVAKPHHHQTLLTAY